ncbi:hypothetical protein BDW75DRAFT_77383 [Aspergillus navahoensis]
MFPFYSMYPVHVSTIDCLGCANVPMCLCRPRYLCHFDYATPGHATCCVAVFGVGRDKSIPQSGPTGLYLLHVLAAFLLDTYFAMYVVVT